MVCLEALKEFFCTLNDFTPIVKMSIIRKLELDLSEQLSKIEHRYEYASFTIIGTGGRESLERLITKQPKSKVYKVKLYTFADVLRQTNKKYPQTQMLTRDAFGLKIDIMTRKRTDNRLQLIILSEKGLEYPTLNSTNFLTSKMKEEIDGYNNRERERRKMSTDTPSGIQRVPN